MDTNLINRRRDEVIQEINLIQKRRSELEKELAELETAERVIARLSGAERSPIGETDERKPETPSGGKPEGIPTMPKMIMEALTAYDPFDGAKPRAVRDWIADCYWSGVKVDSVASILWRMWKRGQLEKKDSHYMLPQNVETADADPTKETPTASLFQPDAQGREAGPGGGT